MSGSEPERLPLDAAIIEALPAAVFVCGAPDGRLLRYNQRAVELWGREPALGTVEEELYGASRLFEPGGDPLAGHATPMARALETGEEVRDVDIVVQRPNGTSSTVAVTASPLRDAEGHVVAAVGVFHDVTDRRRAEERERLLLEASALLGTTFDHQTILRKLASLTLGRFADWCLIDVVDEDGQLQGVAGAHAQPDKERYVNELLTYRPTFGTIADSVLRSGESYLLSVAPRTFVHEVALDQRHLAVLQELSPESLMVVPLKARGRVFGLITFVLTQSHRRFDREDLPLGEGIGRRAALAIDNARLFRESQQANRLKDEFLATLSHELRTPLNAVLGWTQLLLTGQMAESETRHALQTIRRNAVAQARLIADILDVSRIITGKLRLNVRTVPVASVIRGAVDAIQPAADARHIELSVDTGPEEVVLFGDPDRLQQIVWNLLSNAVKFTPPGGRVSVTTGTEGTTAIIRVSDTGSGIPPQFLPSLFERFRQADSSTTRSYGGLGLGLAIVRHLVELHGGSVQGTSEGEGRGATFTVLLPFHRAADPAHSGDVSSPQPASADEGTYPSLDGLKVLVVDDDRDSRELTRMVLQHLGATVEEADSSMEAIAIIRHTWPDVLLADIGMPHEDGYTLIRRVRALEAEMGRRLPAAAVTAYAQATDEQKTLVAGFDDYLAKPVAPSRVADLVARLARRFTTR